MSKHIPWVLICGAVRQPDIFLKIAMHYLALLREGSVGGVLLSTWKGELDRHPRLRSILAAKGMRILEIDDPGSDRGNFTRQMTQLAEGLALIPENERVLKTRTDRVSPINPGDLQQDLSIDRQDGDLHPFKERIQVTSLVFYMPFYLHDFSYYGKREDLLKLAMSHVSLNAEQRIVQQVWNAEMRLFATPFIPGYPILGTFGRRLNPYFVHQIEGTLFSCFDALPAEGLDRVERLVDIYYSEPFLRDVMLTWWGILDRYFVVGMGNSGCAERLETIRGQQLHDMFTVGGASAFGFTHQKDNPVVVASNTCWLDALKEGALEGEETKGWAERLETLSDVNWHRQTSRTALEERAVKACEKLIAAGAGKYVY